MRKIIFVELLGIRDESVILYLWGMNPLAYFSLLLYIETCWLHLCVRCAAAFDAFRDHWNVSKNSLQRILILSI